jgi:serine/threonine protein kinase
VSAVYDGALMPAGPLSAGHKLGRYEVLAKLASGGMAVVYVASAQGAAGFERIVAIKVLHANLAYEEEFIHMFLDEARLAALIRHPNVVSTIEISDSMETGYYLVMEYIEGDHLGALLSGAHKAGASLPVPVVLRIILDALSGLSAAHNLHDDAGRAVSVVHRDVSPHNILVGRDGVSRLTDFGVAKAEDRLTHTREGQVKGKLAYMAPEQASTGVSDTRSDLFSMGIILWECVTGRRLFRAESTAATLTRLLSEEIALPSAIDASLAPLDSVLRKALDRDPSLRFQTAEEFIEAIESSARGLAGLASRRAVGKAVKQYAADKLARDRRLIMGAQRSLRDGAPLRVSELPPATESSLSSLSRSKPSGIFSNLTTAGRRRRGRSQPPGAGHTSDASLRSAGNSLLAPPPLGKQATFGFPETTKLELFNAAARPRMRWPFAVSLMLLSLVVAWAWLEASRASRPKIATRVEITPPPSAINAAPTEQPRSRPLEPKEQPSTAEPEGRAAAAAEAQPSTAPVVIAAPPSFSAARNTRWGANPARARRLDAPLQHEESAPAPAPSSDTAHDLLPNPYKQ